MILSHNAVSQSALRKLDVCLRRSKVVEGTTMPPCLNHQNFITKKCSNTLISIENKRNSATILFDDQVGRNMHLGSCKVTFILEDREMARTEPISSPSQNYFSNLASRAQIFSRCVKSGFKRFNNSSEIYLESHTINHINSMEKTDSCVTNSIKNSVSRENDWKNKMTITVRTRPRRPQYK